MRCEGSRTDQVSYNSCRNRHCPMCQSAAAQRWLDARQADLLPVEYCHVVFTLPALIADIAYANKALMYALLFDVPAEVLQTIAADPKHLGAWIGATLVLHTWCSALTHHPHVHGIVPGGGLSTDGSKTWVAYRPGFFLPVRVLSRLLRRRFSEELLRLHGAGQLKFFGEHAGLSDACQFKAWLAPLRKTEWAVCAKWPFAGPKAVLAHLSRDTHRVGISNRRLVAMDDQGVSFRWKDYRANKTGKGRTRHKTMPLAPPAMRRRCPGRCACHPTERPRSDPRRRGLKGCQRRQRPDGKKMIKKWFCDNSLDHLMPIIIGFYGGLCLRSSAMTLRILSKSLYWTMCCRI